DVAHQSNPHPSCVSCSSLLYSSRCSLKLTQKLERLYNHGLDGGVQWPGAPCSDLVHPFNEFTFPMDKLEHLVISSKNECSYSKLMYHFMDAYGHDVLIDSGPYEMTMLKFEADQKLGFWEDKRSHGTSTVIVVKRLNHEGIQGHQDWLVLVKYDWRSEQEFF
ncbi:hypothetical protein R6Q59_012480, partial [Mikania micrantha]